MSKKSRLTTSLAVLAATIMLLAGGTFAYLKVTSEEKVNTFDTDLVTDTTVTVTEPEDETYTFIPGGSDDKTATVTVNSDLAVYVFVKVTDETNGYVTYDIDPDVWTELEGYERVYYTTYNPDEDDDNTFYVLKDNKVSYDVNVTKEQLAAVAPLKLSFKATIIQSDVFDSAEDAWEGKLSDSSSDTSGGNSGSHGAIEDGPEY